MDINLGGHNSIHNRERDTIQSTTGRSASNRRHNNDSIKLHAQPPDRFGLLVPLNQQAEKGVILWSEVTDPDYQEEVGEVIAQW